MNFNMDMLNQDKPTLNVAMEQQPRTLAIPGNINTSESASSNINNALGTRQKSNQVESQMDIDEKSNNNNNNNTPTAIKEYSGVTEPSRSLNFVPPRAYLDEAVVPTLLEGMKLLVSERPSNPLAFLGQFLIDRSKSSGSSME